MCTKRAYASRYDANMALLLIWKQHRPDGHEREAYLCTRCGAYHLTSWVDGKPQDDVPFPHV